MSFQAMNWAMDVNRSGLLKSNEAFVLLVLANYADEEWSCFPSQERLAQDTAQTTRSVVRQLKQLQSLGLVTSESRYGTGRGRIGNRYFLLKDAFQKLVQDRETERSDNLSPESHNRMNTRSDNLSPKPENREIERSDNVSPESYNRMNTRSDNVSPERLKCHPRHDSSDIDDFSEQVPLKEHARINHHHQSSSDAHDENTAVVQTIDDDDDQNNFYRGVNIDQLFSDVVSLAGYRDEPALVAGAVDVVLDRATGRVANPTAYVRKALVDDLYGVMAAAMQAGPVPTSAFSDPYQPAETGVAVLHAAAGVDSAVADSDENTWAVPQLSELSADAVPCTNMDHLQNYDMSARRLAHCNWCRIEKHQDDDEYPHVADATDAQIDGLPHRLQQWAAQFRCSDVVTKRVS